MPNMRLRVSLVTLLGLAVLGAGCGSEPASAAPTPAGDQVRNALTDHMTVEQGLATAKVAMMYGPSVINRGPGGWAVRAIHDTRTTSGR